MTDDPYDPERPFEYECSDCERRFDASDLDVERRDLIACPECGGDAWNVTAPSGE
jgi:DNA-directed RNA polymerase subunit RPC12/RpoP